MNDTITATVRELAENATNYGHNKELVGAYSVIGTIGGTMRELVTCRTWMGRSRSASTVYAAVWVHGPSMYASGKGTAGGYGYHKESAAVGDAISSAGFDLSKHINGCGERPMIEALEALARLAGAEGELLTVQH